MFTIATSSVTSASESGASLIESDMNRTLYPVNLTAYLDPSRMDSIPLSTSASSENIEPDDLGGLVNQLKYTRFIVQRCLVPLVVSNLEMQNYFRFC